MKFSQQELTAVLIVDKARLNTNLDRLVIGLNNDAVLDEINKVLARIQLILQEEIE